MVVGKMLLMDFLVGMIFLWLFEGFFCMNVDEFFFIDYKDLSLFLFEVLKFLELSIFIVVLNFVLFC